MDKSDSDQQTIPDKQPRRKRKWLWLIIIVVVIASVVTTVIIKNKNSNPFPKNIRTSADFPLYYPDSLPSGYELSRASIKYDRNIVFYNISHGNSEIRISEQSKPTNPPDFSAIQKAYSSFRKVDIPAGQAISGDYRGTPTAIMLTNTTLINLSASQGTPEDVLVKLVQSLQSLPN